ncbi:MAG: T9SS type A sorting domain-containing protein [Rhodothermales bacterium]
MIHIYSGDPTQQANLIDCSDAPGGGTTDRVQTDIQPLQVIYVRVSGATSGPQGSYFLNTIDLLNTDAEEGGTPTSATLSAAYPNPFADQTTLDYVLPAAQDIHVAVYDVLGREVAVLHEGVQTAGEHEATFDAAGLPSGLYVVRLTVGDQTLARRVTIVR